MFIYLPLCASIFSSTVTASALVVLSPGANWFAPFPSIMPSYFMAATEPFAQSGMSLSSAKPVAIVAVPTHLNESSGKRLTIPALASCRQSPQ
ncbi:hypothetical protein O9H85_24520 [Paenibacillus filicis]|uniref:Secreted protein n=1 Tax=Paenibacillus gyeongsangnamensis TaxID=3388067 RepID=A0ABT4QFE5_9BACL|nr:hypothetical protein [Paenibacillus filicis]MCZ8515512.1 hypothetical protein [Paenibacillus filicis]